MAIRIKPSHKGLLHKNLGVKKGKKLTSKQIAVKPGDSTAVKRRKIFAQNAKKWHH